MNSKHYFKASRDIYEEINEQQVVLVKRGHPFIGEIGPHVIYGEINGFLFETDPCNAVILSSKPGEE